MDKTAKAISNYGEAVRAWYINQHSEEKCKKAARYQKRADKLIDQISVSETRSHYRNLYLKEHWSTIHLKAHI